MNRDLDGKSSLSGLVGTIPVFDMIGSLSGGRFFWGDRDWDAEQGTFAARSAAVGEAQNAKRGAAWGSFSIAEVKAGRASGQSQWRPGREHLDGDRRIAPPASAPCTCQNTIVQPRN